MPRYTVTPWRDVSELLRLRGQLYRLGEFKDADRRQEAVNQVSATHPPVLRKKKKGLKKTNLAKDGLWGRRSSGTEELE